MTIDNFFRDIIDKIAATIKAETEKIINKATKDGSPVIAVGCDCDKEHQKIVCVGIQNSLLDKLREHHFILDLSVIGINTKLVICVDDDYATTMSKVASIIEDHPGEFMMSRPDRGALELSPWTKLKDKHKQMDELKKAIFNPKEDTSFSEKENNQQHISPTKH